MASLNCISIFGSISSGCRVGLSKVNEKFYGLRLFISIGSIAFHFDGSSIFKSVSTILSLGYILE